MRIFNGFVLQPSRYQLDDNVMKVKQNAKLRVLVICTATTLVFVYLQALEPTGVHSPEVVGAPLLTPRMNCQLILRSIPTTWNYFRFFLTPKMRVDHLFGIKHYAGDVEYDTRGIIEKNRDNLPQEGVDLLLSSEIPFTVLLGTIEANKNAPPPESSLTPKSKAGGGGRRGGTSTWLWFSYCFVLFKAF